MFPSSLPCTTTPLASTLALTWPLGPTVRLFPLRAMLPSTWPSKYRSSLPESSPLMKTDLPICAKPLAGALIGRSPVSNVLRCRGIRDGLLPDQESSRQRRMTAHCNDYTQGGECAASHVSSVSTRFTVEKA